MKKSKRGRGGLDSKAEMGSWRLALAPVLYSSPVPLFYTLIVHLSSHFYTLSFIPCHSPGRELLPTNIRSNPTQCRETQFALQFVSQVLHKLYFIRKLNNQIKTVGFVFSPSVPRSIININFLALSPQIKLIEIQIGELGDTLWLIVI